ncbi:DUF975 family protein [Lactococcus taiwanensis]|uniref:DUF975 family protein n=1 Tax=Lactococcus taiwanensis TaxID=1151742 RepID=UPI0019085E32|nr:DUF975 family protein [Lactococcus taiwanensis]
MKNRVLKRDAREALKQNFPQKMFLFIISIISGITGVGPILENIIKFFADHNKMGLSGFWTTPAFGKSMELVFLILFVIFAKIVSTGAIFVYINIFRGYVIKPSIRYVFAPFLDKDVVKILSLNVTKGLAYILLALIPFIGWGIGLYLALGWSQATYILFDQLDNGNYQSIWKVLKASSKKMRGKRWDYLGYRLSFIGWELLNIIFIGVIGFWTIPYINMSLVAYYEKVII